MSIYITLFRLLSTTYLKNFKAIYTSTYDDFKETLSNNAFLINNVQLYFYFLIIFMNH